MAFKSFFHTSLVVRAREVPITCLQWLQQRLNHCHRGGPGSQPGLLLALLYRLDSLRMREIVDLARGDVGRREALMADHPGTLASIKRFRQDLTATMVWRRPAAFSLTFSTSSGTADMLGAWVVHQGGLAGEERQVWAMEDERERLGGREEEGEVYYVHQRGQGEVGTCPFHPNCLRTPLEAWRARFVTLITEPS